MNLIIVIIIVVLIYSMLRCIYRQSWNKQLNIKLEFSQENAFEGEEIQLTETITNKKILPLPVVMLKFNVSRCLRFTDTCTTLNDCVNDSFKDGNNSVVTDYVYRNDITYVGPLTQKKRAIPVSCTSRGYCNISNLYRICSDPFLSSKLVDSQQVNTHIYIFPRFLDTQKFETSFKSLMGEILTKRYINEDPFEFRGIRDYQSFDPLKSVNWKASARSMNLKVNQTDATSSCQVTILLNLESSSGLRDEELDESSIRLAATLANQLSRLGIMVSFITNARDDTNSQVIQIPHGCGDEHIKSILMGLAKINVYHHKPDSFCNIVTHAVNNSQKNDWFLVISGVISDRINLALEPVINDLKYIFPTRPDDTYTIPDFLKNSFLPFIINY